jgi:two-component system, OmpR family, sensor histidine kinase TorS
MTKRDSERIAPSRGAQLEQFIGLGQISGELIHDLANMLALVHGRAALALGDARAGRPATSELERLVETSEDLSALLRDVLEVLRGGKVSPEVGFDPMRLVKRAVRRFLDSAPPIEIRLISTLPDGVEVRGRASFLDRALLNLLNNAARYAQSEVRLSLSLDDSAGPELVLIVEDDGPGLSAAQRSALFQPLAQGDFAVGAAGLGLSSTHWAVRQLHGSIRYFRGRELGGAAFEVRAPARVRQQETARPQRDVLRGRRLVLLEDQPLVERVLVRLMKRMGAEVESCNPGALTDEEVLRFVESVTPDAVLMDLRLGARQGGDLWKMLQKRLPSLAKRVVFLSGISPGDPEWRSASATGQPILAKPVEMSALAAVLAQVLAAESED